MVLRVQDLMSYSLSGKKGRELLALLDGGCSYENWLSCRMYSLHIIHYRIELARFIIESEIRKILSLYGKIRRNDYNIEIVNLLELSCFGISSTCHT